MRAIWTAALGLAALWAPAAGARAGPAQEPDVAAILRRAAAAYDRIESLRADFTQRLENRLLGVRGVSRGTLYQRQPDRFLMRFADPKGDVVVGDGRYFWIYYPSVDPRQVIRTPAAEVGAGPVDLRAQFVGDPLARFSARLEGVEAVAGRRAYVVTLMPKRPAGYTRLKVWIDAGDSLVRRFEIEEGNGNVRHFELARLVVNPRLGDELFRFTPPAGVRVVDRS